MKINYQNLNPQERKSLDYVLQQGWTILEGIFAPYNPKVRMTHPLVGEFDVLTDFLVRDLEYISRCLLSHKQSLLNQEIENFNQIFNNI